MRITSLLLGLSFCSIAAGQQPDCLADKDKLNRHLTEALDTVMCSQQDSADACMQISVVPGPTGVAGKAIAARAARGVSGLTENEDDPQRMCPINSKLEVPSERSYAWMWDWIVPEACAAPLRCKSHKQRVTENAARELGNDLRRQQEQAKEKISATLEDFSKRVNEPSGPSVKEIRQSAAQRSLDEYERFIRANIKGGFEQKPLDEIKEMRAKMANPPQGWSPKLLSSENHQTLSGYIWDIEGGKDLNDRLQVAEEDYVKANKPANPSVNLTKEQKERLNRVITAGAEDHVKHAENIKAVVREMQLDGKLFTAAELDNLEAEANRYRHASTSALEVDNIHREMTAHRLNKPGTSTSQNGRQVSTVGTMELPLLSDAEVKEAGARITAIAATAAEKGSLSGEGAIKMAKYTEVVDVGHKSMSVGELSKWGTRAITAVRKLEKVASAAAVATGVGIGPVMAKEVGKEILLEAIVQNGEMEKLCGNQPGRTPQEQAFVKGTCQANSHAALVNAPFLGKPIEEQIAEIEKDPVKMCPLVEQLTSSLSVSKAWNVKCDPQKNTATLVSKDGKRSQEVQYSPSAGPDGNPSVSRVRVSGANNFTNPLELKLKNGKIESARTLDAPSLNDLRVRAQTSDRWKKKYEAVLAFEDPSAIRTFSGEQIYNSVSPENKGQDTKQRSALLHYQANQHFYVAAVACCAGATSSPSTCADMGVSPNGNNGNNNGSSGTGPSRTLDRSE